jgi:thiol-disulfide isomerase/thioredoxin
MEYFARAGIAILAFFIAANAVWANPEVHGTISANDGKPIPKAAVRLAWPSGITVASADARPDGRFTLTTDRSGLMLLQFAGVNHLGYTTIVVLDASSNVNVAVRLTTPDIDPTPAHLVVNAMPGKDYFNPQPMVRQADGRYVADFPAAGSTFAYRIEGAIKGSPGPVSGRDGQDYQLRWFPPGGIYYTVVTPTAGRVRILFDPKQFPSAVLPARVDFPANARQSLIDRLYQPFLRRERQVASDQDAALQVYVKTGARQRDFQFHPTPLPAVDLHAIVRQPNQTADAVARQFAWLVYLDATVPAHASDPQLVRSALAALTARSPFWSLRPRLVEDAIEASGAREKYAGYAGQVIESISDRLAQAQALRGLVSAAYEADDQALLEESLRRLGKDFADLPPAQRAIADYGDTKLTIGAALPRFAVPVMNQPGRTYTNTVAASAKFLLIDFWATWCPPCVAEMPNLSKAYAEFHTKGLEILSCSLDEQAAAVETFRRERFPMPWLHAQGASIENEMYQQFGIFGVPSAVLVDSKGVVLASNEQLRGASLRQTLGTLLK